MAEFALPKNSKVKKGKVWPAAAAALHRGLLRPGAGAAVARPAGVLAAGLPDRAAVPAEHVLGRLNGPRVPGPAPPGWPRRGIPEPVV